MCGRYALTSPPAVIAERFHLLWTPEVEPHYNIAPSQTIAVVRETRARQGARAAHAARRHRPRIPPVAGVTYLCSLVAGRLLRRTGFRPRKRPAER
ncbi:MAG TPA: SOS response-associated peptidase family protein [Steroidobacteraceae bacterium]|nr:SOS response-associated peptidase family protein [Steroidobacteraceae bacterium]